MKKSIIFFALIAVSISKSYSQNTWNLDFNVGTLVGNYLSDYGVSVSSNVSYLIPINENIKVGPTAGYSRLLLNGDDFNFLPIAIAGRIHLTDKFMTGIDLGYSIRVDEILDGGFYYRPKVIYTFSKFNIIGSYVGFSQNPGTISTINIGAEIKL